MSSLSARASPDTMMMLIVVSGSLSAVVKITGALTDFHFLSKQNKRHNGQNTFSTKRRMENTQLESG